MANAIDGRLRPAHELWALRRTDAPRESRLYEGERQQVSDVYCVAAGLGIQVRLVRVPMMSLTHCRCVGCDSLTDPVGAPSAGYCWACEQADCQDRDVSEQSAFHGVRGRRG